MIPYANIRNRHFASIGNRLASDLPSGVKSFRYYLPLNVPSCSFVFDSVLPSEIELNSIGPRAEIGSREGIEFNINLLSFPTFVVR